MRRIIIAIGLVIGLSACQSSEQVPVVSFPEAGPSAKKLSAVAYAEVLKQPYKIASSHRAYGDSLPQRVYYWPATTEPKSVLVFIHGGCWLNEFDYTHGRGLFTALAKEGIATYAVEYPRTGDTGGGWPGSLNDIQLGLDTVGQWITEQSQNHLPVNLAGHSAGGHLALLAAQTATLTMNKVIGLAAITDPAAYAAGTNSCQIAAPLFFGGSPDEVPDAYKNATPNPANIAIPVMLLQGGADAIVPLEQSTMRGVRTLIVSGAGHFDWLHADSEAYLQFLKELRNGN